MSSKNVSACLLCLVVLLPGTARAAALADGLAASARHDWPAAFRILKPFADKGDPAALAVTGAMYVYGQGVRQDQTQAMDLLTKAAAQGSAVAQFQIGLLYYYGAGVAKDEKQAASWYRKAADQGLPNAQFELAETFYHYGFGGRHDDAEALKWFHSAAENGHKYARYELGEMYERGYGAAQDYAQAYFWEAAAGDFYLRDDVKIHLQPGVATDQYQSAAAWSKAHPFAAPLPIEIDWEKLRSKK